MRTPKPSLIVAAESWLPFSRHVGLHTLLADGAAAALVTRHPAPGWRVRGLTICTPAMHSSSSVIATPVDSATLMGAIDKALARAACQVTQMDWIVPAKTDNGLLRSIRMHGDLPLERIWLGDDTPAIFAQHTRHVLIASHELSRRAMANICLYGLRDFTAKSPVRFFNSAKRHHENASFLAFRGRPQSAGSNRTRKAVGRTLRPV